MIMKRAFLISTACLVYFGCGNLDLENPDKTVDDWSKTSTDAGSSSNDALSEEQSSSISSSSDALPNMSSLEDVSASSIGNTLSSSANTVSSSSVKTSISKLSLWNRDSPDARVQVPCLTNNTKDNNGDLVIDSKDCGGWWYGYVYPESSTVTPSDENRFLILLDKDGLAIPNGNLTDQGLYVEALAVPGSVSEPSVAGIGFNWNSFDSNNTAVPMDISNYSGLCLDYSLTGSDFDVELSWDEADYGYDTYYARLFQTGGTRQSVVLLWDAFEQVGWDGATKATKDTALVESVGIKIRAYTKTSTSKSGTLHIYGLSWHDGVSCK